MGDRIYFKLERYKKEPVLTLVTCSSRDKYEALMSDIGFIITLEGHLLEEDILYMYEESEPLHKELWEMPLIKNHSTINGEYVSIMGYRIAKKNRINISIM